MEQYLQCIDYTLWKIVENGNAPIVTKTVDGKETVIPPISVVKKAQRRAELKERSTLLMALPNEHQLKFNSYKDAKTLMQAIENRFGGNTATKKTLKNLLKQQYENFDASISEVIEQTYERLQKLISQLEMHEIETLSLDDLFNNLKAYELEVKRTYSSTTNSHNVAFLSSSSTNSATRAVNTAQGVNTTSTQGVADSSTSVENLSDAVIYSFFASWAPRNQDSRNMEPTRRIVPVEETTSNALVSQCDGFGYDWSDQAEEECVKDLKEQNEQLVKDLRTTKVSAVSYKTGLEFVEARLVKSEVRVGYKEKDEVQLTIPKNLKNSSKNLTPYLLETNEPVTSRKENGAPIIEDWVSDSDEENVPKIKIVERSNKPSFAKINFVKYTEQGTRVNTARPKAVISAVKGNKENVVKASAWQSRQDLKDKRSIENLIDLRVKVIRYDNGTEFKNRVINQFFEMKGIKREFSVARTPQQNRVAERKNRTLIEAARTMLADSKLATTFWAEAVNTACYVQKHVIAKMETVLGKDYILLPMWPADPLFSQNLKEPPDAGFKPSREKEKKDAEDLGNKSGNPTKEKDSEVPSTEEPRINQAKDDYINSTNNINTASDGNNTNNVNAVSSTVNVAITEVNAVDLKTSIELPNDPNMPELEDIVYSDDDKDVSAEADMNNLDAFMP
ncbi:ribonuclease H-like domain-containing protein, partial [Tanacetum coccineum]